MAVEIVNNYIDDAGWRRVLVRVDGLEESMSLKFPPGTSASDMRTQAQAVYDSIMAARAAVVTARARVDAINTAIARYQLGQLTTAQRTSLLDALIVEWKV